MPSLKSVNSLAKREPDCQGGSKNKKRYPDTDL